VLAYGDIWYGGHTRNPWNPEEGSNGSSSGSAAAVAAGLVAFSLGTETMGSLTSPALRCGCVGLRPTFGQVPRTGAMALCWSLDKIGPMTRTAEDSALVLQALIGHDPGDPASQGGGMVYEAERAVVDQRRVGYVPAWLEASAEPARDREILEALKALGVRLVEVDWPELPYAALMPILFAESAAAFEELTLSGRDGELAWQAPEAWPNTFRAARFLSAIDLLQADRLRRQVMEALAKTMEGLDAVVAPAGVVDPVIATNFTGQPSIALRAALVDSATRRDFRVASIAEGERHRVPYGTSFIGPLYGEGPLVEIAHALETHLDVWAERPKLAALPTD
jgi:Asp-tRNA(Asn)/Glu-tRNA(Gln) amidotransferase A subunit family amidase